jgi:hypothetical protein
MGKDLLALFNKGLFIKLLFIKLLRACEVLLEDQLFEVLFVVL